LVENGKYFEFLNHLLSLFCMECGLADKTVMFILDEFDLFAQVKLYFLFPLTVTQKLSNKFWL
jgi:hypothetical protein